MMLDASRPKYQDFAMLTALLPLAERLTGKAKRWLRLMKSTKGYEAYEAMGAPAVLGAGARGVAVETQDDARIVAAGDSDAVKSREAKQLSDVQRVQGPAISKPASAELPSSVPEFSLPTIEAIEDVAATPRDLMRNEDFSGAILLRKKYNLIDSLHKYEEAREGFQETMAAEQYALVVRNQAFIDEMLGKADDAAKKYYEACEILREIDDKEALYAETVMNLANLHVAQDKLEFALKEYERAEKVFERPSLEENVLHAAVVMNKGIVYKRMQRAGPALAMMERSSKMYLKLRGAEHAHYGLAIFNLGMMLGSMGRICEARSRFAEVIAIYRRAFGRDHVQTVAAQKYLDVCDYRMRHPNDWPVPPAASQEPSHKQNNPDNIQCDEPRQQSPFRSGQAMVRLDLSAEGNNKSTIPLEDEETPRGVIGMYVGSPPKDAPCQHGLDNQPNSPSQVPVDKTCTLM